MCLIKWNLIPIMTSLKLQIYESYLQPPFKIKKCPRTRIQITGMSYLVRASLNLLDLIRPKPRWMKLLSSWNKTSTKVTFSLSSFLYLNSSSRAWRKTQRTRHPRWCVATRSSSIWDKREFSAAKILVAEYEDESDHRRSRRPHYRHYHSRLCSSK